MTALTREGCLGRQRRLREQLAALKLDAALLTDPAHVMYLCNYHGRAIYAPAVLVTTDGPVVLSVPVEPCASLFADEVVTHEAARYATLVEDVPGAALTPLLDRMRNVKRLGCDAPARPWRLGATLVDVNPTLRALRRRKDADEVSMIRAAIAGTEAAFAAARDFLRPGVTEVQVYARMLSAAVEAVGEPIGEFGNDFRAGEPGGPPRPRKVEAGQLMPLDVGVSLRGYHSDLCRTMAVDRRPTDAQRDAHQLVLKAQEHARGCARPGVSCKTLFDEAEAILRGHPRWKTLHHLGHGIGLSCHESPRLNPNWDDRLEVGDVFTLEPGVYAPELRGGVRVEDNFLVTPTGVERLSAFPTDL